MKAKEIEADIRAGAEYVTDSTSIYGVIKIKDAPVRDSDTCITIPEMVKS